jgi:membrane-bound metal-dependent hydrolase YbcI (DUF457 family)
MLGADRRRWLRGVTDPAVHAAYAALVLAPLARRARWGPLAAGVAAGTLIDVDHVVVARSLRLADLWGLGARPRAHSLPLAAVASGLAWRAAGPRYGWAAFGGLCSHVLRDATDGGTPLLWPLGRRDRVPRWVFAGAVVGLLAASEAIARAS